MSKKPGNIQLQIRLTGKEGETDGIMEMLLGMLVMTGTLNGVERSKKLVDGGMVKIYMNVDMGAAPLGNLGVSDMPDYNGDNP